MKTLFNPTDNKVVIAYKGKGFEIKPKSESQPLSDEQVNFWTKVHSFLVVKELSGDNTVDIGIDTSSTSSEVAGVKTETTDNKITAKVIVEKKKRVAKNK